VAELLFPVLGIERASQTPAGREFRAAASRPAQAHVDPAHTGPTRVDPTRADLTRADLTGVAAE
jgi:hypothetical protein